MEQLCWEPMHPSVTVEDEQSLPLAPESYLEMMEQSLSGAYLEPVFDEPA